MSCCRAAGSAGPISTSIRSLVRPRIRAWASSSRVFAAPPPSAIGFAAGSRKSGDASCSTCCRRSTWSFARAARPTTRRLPRCGRSCWRGARGSREQRRFIRSTTSPHPRHSRVPAFHFPRAATVLPVHAELLAVRTRGDRAPWRVARHVAGRASHRSMPPVESGWLRSRTLTMSSE